MWLIHMHTCLPLGRTLHQRAYTTTVLGMLGGTQTSHAGNCSRCGRWKPTGSHAGAAPLPAEAAADGNVSFGASEQNQTLERAYPVILSTPDLGSSLALQAWRVSVGVFQNIHFAFTSVSRRGHDWHGSQDGSHRKTMILKKRERFPQLT